MPRPARSCRESGAPAVVALSGNDGRRRTRSFVVAQSEEVAAFSVAHASCWADHLCMRVLWLFGPPGVGKSTTAWEVLNALSRDGAETAYVDIDQLGMVYPAPEDDPYAERLAGHALAAVADVYERQGAEWLVVSGVLNPDLMPFYIDLMAPFELSMIHLTVDLAELKARMDARGVDNAGWDEVLEDLEAYEAANLETPVVVAGGVPPDEIARRVIAAAIGTPHTESTRRGAGEEQEPKPKPRSRPAGDAILIGGTPGVGKSSVAWTAFMSLRNRGTRTAFVDLRQIGFMGRDGGPINHELQAAALAALWPVHWAAGAHLLLLNGPVNSTDQADIYRSALRETRLTWYRLVATESALATRIQGRRKGRNTARLAGDTLSDLDDAAAFRVARESFEAQEHAQSHPDSPALETSHLSVDAAAEQVLRGVG